MKPKKSARPAITLRGALDALQLARHEAALLEFLATSVEEGFLPTDGGSPRFVISTGTASTEVARAAAVLGVQRVLLERAAHSRGRAERILGLVLRDLPQGETHLLERPDDQDVRDLYGEERVWGDAADHPTANVSRLLRGRNQ